MEHTAELFRALGDVNRLRILNLLLNRGCCCVCNLQIVLEVPQTRISKHLAVLKSSGLIEARREGQWIIYSMAKIKEPIQKAFLKAVRHCFCEVNELMADLARYDRLLKKGELVECY